MQELAGRGGVTGKGLTLQGLHDLVRQYQLAGLQSFLLRMVWREVWHGHHTVTK
jgi:hypothetical protein